MASKESGPKGKSVLEDKQKIDPGGVAEEKLAHMGDKPKPSARASAKIVQGSYSSLQEQQGLDGPAGQGGWVRRSRTAGRVRGRASDQFAARPL